MCVFGSEQFLLETNPVLRIFGKFVGELHFGIRIRFQYLRKRIKRIQTPPVKILDAGSGRGQSTFWLANQFPRAQITGVDINHDNIQHCCKLAEKTRLVGRVSFCKQDLQNLDLKEKYNLIICIDVLEHIQDFRKAAMGLIALLEKDGILIMHTPQKGEYVSKNFWIRKFFNQSDSSVVHEPGAVHVHEGLSKEEFGFLRDLNGKWDIVDTFPRWIMRLHVIFEIYRGKSRCWHLFCTPLLMLLSFIQKESKEDFGGGLLVTFHNKKEG